MVYYGTEDEEPQWKTVCKNGYGDTGGKGTEAICNILGYENGKRWIPPREQMIQEMGFMLVDSYYISNTCNNYMLC